MITELCKRVHCVDLGESFQTHIFLQNLGSIQPRASPVKFARSLAMLRGLVRLDDEVAGLDLVSRVRRVEGRHRACVFPNVYS